jgi:zinc protease
MSAPVRPAPGVARPYEFPAVHRTVLTNGLTLLVAPMPRLPLVTVLALVDAGAATEPTGAEGVATLTARTLAEGAGGRDGATLTAAFERLGTSFEGSADWDSSLARLTVTRSRLEAAFALFSDVLTGATFPEADVARRRDERLAELEQQLAEPRGLADERFSGFLYARDRRYARDLAGTTRSVKGLGAPAVRAFHAAHYGPAATTLVFVGDITPEGANALAERALGAWRGGARPAPMPAVAAARDGRRLVIVEKADAPQSELRVGHIGVPRAHPDYLSIVVMNGILGGLFSSRINLNLREKHAFTYGASSGFDWRRGPGPFVVSTAVKSEVTARAVTEILREIDGLRAAAPDASEVALATDYLAGVFPIRYETTASVAGALAAATMFGLPADWFVTYRERIRAVTPGDVHAAARSQLDPSRLLVLAVGDAPVIEGPLADLGFATVERYASDDDPAEE